MPRKRILRTIIPPDFAGQRLDKALSTLIAAEIPGFSRARLQKLIEDNHVTYGKITIVSGSSKVIEGEEYAVTIPPPEPAIPKAQEIKLLIVYEDRDVIVIDKPPGMVVHPAPGNRDRTLVNALLAHCGDSLSGIGGVARPGIVHRLDKDTGGLMIVAKNDMAHQKLAAQFSDRSLSRVYHALVWGTPLPREGVIDAPIGRHTRDRKKMAVSAKGRDALTHYKVLESFAFVSLVECRLATGRTHQIRVHMAHKKHPLVGDATYGGRGRHEGGVRTIAMQQFERQALHAIELKFIHPRTGKIMKFRSKLPPDMMQLVENLKGK